MNKIIPLTLFVAMSILSGCGHLVLKPDDNVAQKTTKVITRFVLVFPTLGLSEVRIGAWRDYYDCQDALSAVWGSNLSREEKLNSAYRIQYLCESRDQARVQAVQQSFSSFGHAVQHASQNYQQANAYTHQPVYIPQPAPVQQFQMPTMKYGNNNTQQAQTYRPYQPPPSAFVPTNPVPKLNTMNCTGFMDTLKCTSVDGY